MVKINAVYEGGLRCRIRHGPSGNEILTDAPVDNMGKGEAFSPTDLMASSLGVCMLTVMGILARQHNIELLTSAQLISLVSLNLQCLKFCQFQNSEG